LTKGILGGIRELNQQNYLQSDVAILPGNSGGPLLDRSGQVIGITVMGLGAKGLAGMNFFVPVTDALEKLGLKLTTSK
jgi:S1-C subfamily serine protease